MAGPLPRYSSSSSVWVVFSINPRSFNSAIASDSMFAEAYIGKADLLLAVAWRRDVDPDSLLKPILTCIAEAKEIDPRSGLPYSTEGQVYLLYDFDFINAEKSFNKAIELSNDQTTLVSAHLGLMAIYKKRGESKKSNEEYQKAALLNPDVEKITKEMDIDHITPAPYYAGKGLKEGDGLHPALEKRIKAIKKEILKLEEETK